MCGDHFVLLIPAYPLRGSPPHVRGPLGHFLQTPLKGGITPACAGTTRFLQQVKVNPWDHPRMCGDHYPARCTDKIQVGSPPHVRGPPLDPTDIQGMSGITPACAGTTGKNMNRVIRTWDHPRMCGDHHRSYHNPCIEPGSPPHVRGPP